MRLSAKLPNDLKIEVKDICYEFLSHDDYIDITGMNLATLDQFQKLANILIYAQGIYQDANWEKRGRGHLLRLFTSWAGILLTYDSIIEP